MLTILLPTTREVSQKMSIREALNSLKSENVEFDIVGSTIDGMYVSENGEIVEEQLVPISGNVTSRQIATWFTQECVLEFDNKQSFARLVSKDGDIWAEFDKKIEVLADTVENAVEIQRRMAKDYGGSSRIDKLVWAWTQEVE